MSKDKGATPTPIGLSGNIMVTRQETTKTVAPKSANSTKK